MNASEPKQYASESCHAYDWEGNPHHEVPYADKKRSGEFRPTTLRDIKKNGWLPSVSSILSIQAKPGLDNWKKEQVARACCEMDWYSGGPWTDDEKMALVPLILERAESNMSKARDLGTEIHGAIERYLKWLYEEELKWPPEERYAEHINAACAAIKEFGAWGQPFRAERSFASPLGYGGCLDFCTETHIGDFKCVDSLEKKLDYHERCAQLASYSMGVHGKLVRCANVFISTSEPGKYLLREWTPEELQYGWKLFCACFELYKVVNKFDPVLNAQHKQESNPE